MYGQITALFHRESIMQFITMSKADVNIKYFIFLDFITIVRLFTNTPSEIPSIKEAKTSVSVL